MTGRRSERRQEARRQEAARARRRRALLVGLAAGAVVLVAALVAVLATQRPAPAASAAPTGSPLPLPVVTGSPLPRFESPTDDPAVGQPAPIVKGTDFDGRPVTIEPDGRPKLVIFLAHWCPHCQREVPVIQRWLDEQGPPEGVDLVSVVTAIDPSQANYPPDEWLERERWSVPVIVDPDDRIATAYGLNAFPYFVLIDRQGRVVGRLTGELPVETLEQLVEQLAGT